MSTLYSLPADVNYEPQRAVLSSSFLLPQAPPVDAEDWPAWRTAQALLPRARQIRAHRCRQRALHLVKDTPTGSVESVNSIACGDRAACPRCATAYARERAQDHWAKLGVVALTQKVALHFLEFRCVIPEWNAAVKVAGCDDSEVYGRLCGTSSPCPACAGARGAHSGAAKLEADLTTWLQKTWLAVSPYTGGVRHTRLEQASNHAPIELVITLCVPATAVQTFHTAAGDPLAVGTRRAFREPAPDALALAWADFVAANYGGTTSFRHAALVEPKAIENAFLWSHSDSFENFARMLAASGLPIAQDTVRTFTRACSLGTPTASGKARKTQRSAWFGCFTGSNQTQALNALDVRIKATETPATVRVVDTYNILHVGADVVTVQSVHTAEVLKLPARICRLAMTVDAKGRPALQTSDTEWDADTSRQTKLRSAYKQRATQALQKHGVNAGGVQSAKYKMQFGLPRVKKAGSAK